AERTRAGAAADAPRRRGMRADQAVAARRKANGRALPPLAGPLRDARSAPRVERSARDRALPARPAGGPGASYADFGRQRTRWPPRQPTTTVWAGTAAPRVSFSVRE